MKTDRHRTVEINCEICGKLFTARVERVENGQGRFCSLAHANEYQRAHRTSAKIGKENAKTYSKVGGGYFVQWYNEEGKAVNSPWHKWAWEMAYGEIPEGYVVEYVDGNKENIIIENLQLRLTKRGKSLLPKPPKPIKIVEKKVPVSRRKEFTTEMIEDLSHINDADFSEKWGVSKNLIIRRRKELGIKSFISQNNAREHKFENGIELKYCPSEGGHWDTLEKFGPSVGRLDGLRPICRYHSAKSRRENPNKESRMEKNKLWKQSENGKKSLRLTWRKQKAVKDNAYVLWEREHEEDAYNMFDGSCAYCSLKVDFLKIEFDHFVPIKSGGKTEPGNMLPCCKKCNHGVGGKFTQDAWEWLQTKFSLERAGHIFNDCTEKLHYLSMKHQNGE